ncbi:hypothetical protein Ddye_018243 [Dipteronia dyeriana]|uniref:Uncharacterized protein n=1 Tax=Dipteronia dyeriana TaxID=168575 RepID=A0AAD9UAQ2_9ROSI|nr:hypothetical protein Ddye_018243 [Dipteronia dyeriana]
MGENGHQSSEYWSIDIAQENKSEEVLEAGPDCCIYRVPEYLRKINEAAYTPRLISIGPLHYGKFMGMENQKKRFWSEFWKRVNNAQKLEEFKIYIESQEQRIRDHYSVSSTLQSSKYVAMIQLDAVFIFEFFLRNYNDTDDFLLKSPSLCVSITADLLLLENQVPYSVLNHLYAVTFPGSPSFFRLSLSVFSNELKFNLLSLLIVEPNVKHFTDLLRHAFVMEVQPSESNRGGIFDVPTVTKLNESGLNFSGVKDKCYLDINLVKRKRGKWLPWFEVKWLPRFEVNELQIPRIKIYDETEGLFRNMMALEQFHYPTKTHMCNYVDLLDNLIDTVKDVDLLVEKEIIVNCVGDNKVIAKMFNRLGTHIILSDSPYYDIVKRMKAHYKYPWNHSKATLRSAYFSNLWTGTATVAAAFLLILTATQTVYSIMQD